MRDEASGRRDPAASQARVGELDGLRGLAVVAVIAYHAWPNQVPGGWLGVSLFFTLSGYLITGILLRRHRSTRASMAAFWLGRARRLLPLSLVVVVAVVGATAVVDPGSVARVATDALASIFYVQNWREAAAPGGYDAIFDTGLRPLAHLWSLAIEEQVYIVLPLATLWLGPRRMLLVGATITAVATAIWWGSPDAYYATPVRLVEVLAGAWLAVRAFEGRALQVLRPVMIAGAAMLSIGVFTLSESNDLVSRGALVAAALGSLVVIAGATCRPAAFLRLAPLRWLGERSYAIYLIHWPLLVLLDVPPVVALAGSMAAAEISHHLLEWPIRSGRVIRRRPAFVFVALTASSLVLSGTALALAPSEASETEIATTTESAIVAARAERTIVPPTSTTILPTATSATPTPSTPPSTTAVLDTRIPLPNDPTVMLIGDSTAVALEPAVTGWVAALGGEFIPAAENSCSPLFAPGLYDRWSTVLVDTPLSEPCRPPVPGGVDAVLIADHGLPLFNHYDHRREAWTDITEPEFRLTLREAYEVTIAEAAAAGSSVVFMTPPTPFPAFGEWLELHAGTEVARRVAYIQLLDDLAATYANVYVIDVGSAVDGDAERYPRDDGLHLDRDTGAVHVIIDVVAPAFRVGAT